MTTINRVRAGASKWTFKIKPIAELVCRYVGNGKGWIDPYAGECSPAEFTNDIHPDRKATYHLDALDFVTLMNEQHPQYNGVIFDPPYSYRQVSEHYSEVGRKATMNDTNNGFYSRVMNPLCDRVVPGGYVISCGWNTNGFGENRGFEIVEILVVAHGLHHNDTLVTVERKVQP